MEGKRLRMACCAACGVRKGEALVPLLASEPEGDTKIVTVAAEEEEKGEEKVAEAAGRGPANGSLLYGGKGQKLGVGGGGAGVGGPGGAGVSQEQSENMHEAW